MLKPFTKWALAQLGYELRRTPERAANLGRHAIRDMKRFTIADASPVVFDVGGHFGETTLKFRRHFASPTVHTFEPGPDTFKTLMANVGGLPNVIPNNVALGFKSGAGTFVENTSSNMSSFLEIGPDGWGA